MCCPNSHDYKCTDPKVRSQLWISSHKSIFCAFQNSFRKHFGGKELFIIKDQVLFGQRSRCVSVLICVCRHRAVESVVWDRCTICYIVSVTVVPSASCKPCFVEVHWWTVSTNPLGKKLIVSNHTQMKSILSCLSSKWNSRPS